MYRKGEVFFKLGNVGSKGREGARSRIEKGDEMAYAARV